MLVVISNIGAFGMEKMGQGFLRIFLGGKMYTVRIFIFTEVERYLYIYIKMYVCINVFISMYTQFSFKYYVYIFVFNNFTLAVSEANARRQVVEKMNDK